MAILSGTRVEWILVDLGILCAGGATTTIYPSSTPEDCAYILADSETVIAVVEDDGQVAKLTGRRAELPALKQVVVINGTASADGWVITLADLEKRGGELAAKDPQAYERTVHAVQPRRAGHAHLHVGHDRQAEGRRAHPGLLGLRGRGHREHGHPRGRATCSTCGCRWRTRSARCSRRCSCAWASPPPSTAASTRSSRTWRSSSRPSSARCRASSRRCTPRWSRARSRAAGSSSRSSTGRWAWARRCRASSARASRPARGWRCRTASPTSWSSPSSGRASAAACASSSPARRRWRASSPSSSTPPGCSSSRATASPSRARARS